MCDGRCVDPKNNVRHCGDCNLACGEEEVCLDGVCGQSCGPGQDVCDGACVDRQNDASHCGACGNQCEEGALCSRGKCAESCDAGLTVCGSSCVDDRSDRRNCGGCGFLCDVGLDCVDGFCSCPVGQIECKGACLDASADPENCGACGERCPSDGLPHASSAQCRESTCKLQCDFGRGNCNGRAADGCETDVFNDKANCGACGTDCEAGPHVSGARCTGSGGCLITVCDHGWSDVNGNHEDGCEVNTLSHPEHCGVGGTQSSQVDCTRIPNAHDGRCNDGKCAYTCNDNWGDCDGIASNGCEADLRVDMKHCGTCNNACDPGGSCVDNACLPDTEVPNWPLPPESPTDYTVPKAPNDVSTTDNVTGLVWERTPLASKHTWQDAVKHCGSMRLEDKRWRLPTAAELLTIVDSSRTNPTINTSDLKGTVNEQYWTATSTPAGTTAWYVHFGTGVTGVIAKTTAYPVRCVRAGKNERGVRYSLSTDGESVTDNKTGLVWEREPIGTTYPWATAPSRCTNLGGGWRLPTRKELESLVERRKASPMIDAEAFPKVTGAAVWTSTESGTSAWRVTFSTGVSATISKTTASNVICVRKP